MLLVYFSQTPQILKAVNAGAVSIAPARLQRVTADNFEPGELKTFVRVSHVQSGDIAEHIRLAAARRARTRAAQKLQIEERLCLVVPLNGQLTPDLLNVLWFQGHEVSILTGCRS